MFGLTGYLLDWSRDSIVMVKLDS